MNSVWTRIYMLCGYFSLNLEYSSEYHHFPLKVLRIFDNYGLCNWNRPQEIKDQDWWWRRKDYIIPVTELRIVEELCLKQKNLVFQFFKICINSDSLSYMHITRYSCIEFIDFIYIKPSSPIIGYFHPSFSMFSSLFKSDIWICYIVIVLLILMH
jgi:hypothetical protein